MASILRQIVAGPRARHAETGLDLCYVTDNIIATSGPSATYPQVAYRNPLKDLVQFLDSKHGEKWAIWEFRAEGTGYPDSEVYGRIRHYPWPDHHPPPFALMPLIMGSMRNWLKDKEAEGRVVVVHCKAGKGRSGTVACSYLISEEGWTPEDAMQRFTERRMKPGLGNGLSITSQRRYISYVDRWTKHGKKYMERPIEILEVHVWGLRSGVKIVVEGYVEEGKVIKKFHTFQSSERELVRGIIRAPTGFADAAMEMLGRSKNGANQKSPAALEPSETEAAVNEVQKQGESDTNQSGSTDGDVVFRPSSRVILPSSDINIDCERRNKSKYGGFTVVTSVAHAWFNTFFEGNGPEQDGVPDDSGVFELQWEAMDGLKGSSRRGTCAFDRLAVVWKAVKLDDQNGIVINEPEEGQEVKQTKAADWRGTDASGEVQSPTLGLRTEQPDSAQISRASSMKSHQHGETDVNGSAEELNGVKSHGPEGEDEITTADERSRATTEPHDSSQQQPSTVSVSDRSRAQTDSTVAGVVSGVQNLGTRELPGGKPEAELKTHHDHMLGTLKREKK